MPAELGGCVAGELTIGEPPSNERIDRLVVMLGCRMFVFEPRDGRQRIARGGIRAGSKSRKKTLFLIGSVTRRSGREVGDRSLQLLAQCGCERAAVRPLFDDRQHSEEVFDPPMAVAQEAERFIESMIRMLPDCDQHRLLLTDQSTPRNAVGPRRLP